MPGRKKLAYRRAHSAAPAPPARPGRPWLHKVGLILLCVVPLSLAFAPFGQFYLAWVGMVPWLLLVRSTKSQAAAFLWAWVAGLIFFTANMWWLAYVTGPGMVALMVLLALYWGVSAVIIRGAGLLRDDEDVGPATQPDAPPPRQRSPLVRVLLIAAAWVTLEWLRGNWPLNGLPWLFLGHAQTPALAMCQVADVFGVYGISFWVMAVNALVALFVLHRFKADRLVPSAAVVGAVLVVVIAYGLWRMGQTDCLSAGPRVMVVQSNFPQSNSGEKGASVVDLVNYHLNRTEAALQTPDAAGLDLLVWSETMIPHVNRSAREALRGTREGQFLNDVHEALGELTRTHRVALLTGALYADKWTTRDGEPNAADRRNTAYFYDRTGHMAEDATGRYDKVHIVPFGEYLPFKDAFPLLHGLFQKLSPYPDDYFLTAGEESAITVFRLGLPGGATTTAASTAASTQPAAWQSSPAWRFVTPICFEDIDPLLVAKMCRSKSGPGKAADFIVNVTNDGWFKANQMPQHLQAARFRSIENRVPTARSVNTGISGFVDSAGRVSGLVPAGHEGTSVQRLLLDSRVTLYTRVGDVFAALCAAVTCAVAGTSLLRWWQRRRPTGD